MAAEPDDVRFQDFEGLPGLSICQSCFALVSWNNEHEHRQWHFLHAL